MDRFSSLKPKDKFKEKKQNILYKDDHIKLVKYEDWSILDNRDCVMCIPYIIETNEIVLRHEYIPTYKFSDGQEYHITVVAGGIENGETPEVSVLRELEEELGLKRDKLQICLRCQATNNYEFLDPPGYARGKWRGQAQTFWLVKFLGRDSDINLVQPDQELMAWRWCTPDEVLKVAESKRIPGYRAPVKEFQTWWQSNNQAK